MTTSKGIKKKRVSKKNKVSWRKHVNVEDVDNFLEEKRLDERLGKPLSILTNDELFRVDTKSASETEFLSTKQRKRLRLLAPPKCFAALLPHTKVPDPITKRNRVRTKEERMCPIVKRKEKERKLKGIFKAKELQQMKDRRSYELRRNSKPKNIEFNEDVWKVEDVEDKFCAPGKDWIEKLTQRHTLRGIGKLRKIAPKVAIDSSCTPSIEPPHPGTSYNPGYEDHQNLLRQISERELKILKEEEHLKRVTKDMFRKVTVDSKEASWLVEMSEGLPKPQDEIDNEARKGTSYGTVGLPVQNKKKTLKQRRKQKEQLQLKKMRETAKVEKKKRADIHKLKVLNKDIEKEEKRAEVSKQKREENAKLKAKQTKRLGRLKYEEPELDFNFTKDLPGNLRNLKGEGNLLADRFTSLQKRNILEVGVLQIRKRSKIKRVKRPGFKDDWKSTVARSFQKK